MTTANRFNKKNLGLVDRLSLHTGLWIDGLKRTSPKTIIKGAGALAGGLISSAAYATDVVIENTIKPDGDSSNPNLEKTRVKVNQGPVSFSYDLNNHGDVDEAKLWVDVYSGEKFNLGAVVQGTTEKKENKHNADIGVYASKRFGGKEISAFVGPSVETGEKPIMFYQVNLSDTSGKGKVQLSFVDEKGKNVPLEKIDWRPYVSGKKGNVFGGIGTRQKGIDVERVYGSWGLKNDKFGTITVFNYDKEDGEFFFKNINAFGNPSEGTFSNETGGFWLNWKGPGIRDIGVPYFSSFLTKGKIPFKLQGTVSNEEQDYEAMIGKDFGFARAGIGINPHYENGKGSFGGLIHVAKDAKFGKWGEAYAELRGNTRTKNLTGYVNFKKSF